MTGRWLPSGGKAAAAAAVECGGGGCGLGSRGALAWYLMGGDGLGEVQGGGGEESGSDSMSGLAAVVRLRAGDGGGGRRAGLARLGFGPVGRARVFLINST